VQGEKNSASSKFFINTVYDIAKNNTSEEKKRIHKKILLYFSEKYEVCLAMREQDLLITNTYSSTG
jgi:hypothetical protein